MKSTCCLFFLFSSFYSYTQLQSPEAYISFGGFFEEQLDPSAYLNFALGVEPFAYKFIAPEVDITYYVGGEQKEDWDFDQNGEIDFRSYLDRNFESWVWGLGPKLFVQDDFSRIVLIPKYHFGNQRATGQYIDSNNLELTEESKVKFNFWSVSLGYEFLRPDKIGKLGLYLTYTGFNAGKSLNRLDFSEQGYSKGNYQTKAIGITVRLSSGFRKRKV